jgi:hypothetical protein
MRFSVLLLAMGSQSRAAVGEQGGGNQGAASTIKGIVVDDKTMPQAGILVHCSDVETKQMMLGETFSGKDGKFELPISPTL